ncbi:TetR/AcrR family transcriptional regulator [uncultured Microbacterium sp.]|uniref:TetR/AcrR family transcriptional regulator n=1 Tax=uncultured Microbacterium sp. TaxID=191216 RepID=UPI0026005360|nr:TetR/AcrR family transcriptional regulator [uncultured Microbacterium sp.]
MSRHAKGREREEIVLKAAAEAIAELGYANVRVSDIAERAQMTTGHVTYYFPSKNDLLLLAIQRSEEELVQQSREELAGIEDPMERLRHLIGLAAASGFQDDGWLLWLQAWANGLSDPTVSQKHRQLDQRWFEMLTEVVAYGRDLGVFHVARVEDVCETIAAMIDGLSIQVAVGAGRVDRPRMLQLLETGAAALLGVGTRVADPAG